MQASDEMLAEPYKLKIIQSTPPIPETARRSALRKAFYNVYLIPSKYVYIDLLNDTGTSAMSDTQWAGLMIGDEAYAGSRNFFRLEQATREVLGFKFVVPTHNGRGAEHLVAELRARRASWVITNWGSPTAVEHFKRAGASIIDASEENANSTFKGDINLEAMARGIHEMTDDDYIGSRVRQVQYLGRMLLDAKIPIVEPVGGFAVCLDARRFLPHIPQELFPAQMLAAMLYLDSGVRSMERGIASAGRDHTTGENKHPELELVRLTIPRRVYTNSHMEAVARSVSNLYENRQKIGGLRMTYEPPQLRFFSARFEPALA